jgi:hypothetical protein
VSDSAFFPVVYTTDGCGGAELSCGLGSTVAELAAGQSVLVVVDGYGGASGEFEVTARAIPSAELDCADGLDEDHDGRGDCADDECAGQGTCAPSCPDLGLISVPSVVSGTTLGQPDESAGSCDLSAMPGELAAPDASVAFTAPADGPYAFALTGAPSFDTVLYVLDGCGGAELACDDVYPPGAEIVVADLVLGQTVTVVVDGFAGAAGDFDLAVFVPEPSEAGWCGDAVDNDADGVQDCFDKDCEGEQPCLEVCGTDLDEDLDDLYDCLDEDCEGHPSCVETCPEEALAGPLPLQVEGDTLGSADDLEGSCGGARGSDTTFAFTAPSAGTYTFDTLGSEGDTVLYVLDGDCSGAELACDDDIDSLAGNFQSEVQVALSANQTVIVVLDSYDPSAGGAFQLHVRQ